MCQNQVSVVGILIFSPHPHMAFFHYQCNDLLVNLFSYVMTLHKRRRRVGLGGNSKFCLGLELKLTPSIVKWWWNFLWSIASHLYFGGKLKKQRRKYFTSTQSHVTYQYLIKFPGRIGLIFLCLKYMLCLWTYSHASDLPGFTKNYKSFITQREYLKHSWMLTRT